VKIRKATLVQLTRHLACVSHIDQYSQFLIKDMGDIGTFTLSATGSSESYLCSVEQKRNSLIFVFTPVELEEGTTRVHLPSYFLKLYKNKEKELIKKAMNSSDISFSVNEQTIATLLILIDRSLEYRSVKPSGSLKPFSIIRYWAYYLLRIVRRSKR